MRRALIVLAPIWFMIAVCGCSSRHDSRAIDETITRTLDLTKDGQKGLLSLRLQAKSFDAPFSWRLTITTKGREVFVREVHDESDQYFRDPATYNGCNSYEACKRDYYYGQLVNIVVPPSGYDADVLAEYADEEAGKGLRECCRVSGAAAASITAAIKKRLKDGSALAISIPTQATAGPLLVFVPEVDRFVEVWCC